MKKIIALILSMTMLLSMATNVFAGSTKGISESTLTSELLERGYPQIVLDTMSYRTKLDLYKNNNVFLGASVSYYNEETGTFIDCSIQSDGSYIAPRGQIPTSDLALSFVYSRDPYIGGTKLGYIKVHFSYNWLNLPLNRYQDVIAIGWDSSKFTMQTGSFYKEDLFNNGQVQSSEHGYASASDAGVKWYADLTGYWSGIPYRLYGNGSFNLVPTTTTYGGSMNIYGNYAHTTANGSVSVSFGPYGSISFSGNGFDERGTQTTITW